MVFIVAALRDGAQDRRGNPAALRHAKTQPLLLAG